jgi:hypothetical protein
LPVLLYYGINRWISYRERAFEREAIESLRELAIAQEAYYGDYLAYAHDMDVLEELGPFKKNSNVIIVFMVDEDGRSFYSAAKHIKGGRVRCNDSWMDSRGFWSDDPAGICKKPILLDILMKKMEKKTDNQ